MAMVCFKYTQSTGRPTRAAAINKYNKVHIAWTNYDVLLHFILRKCINEIFKNYNLII